MEAGGSAPKRSVLRSTLVSPPALPQSPVSRSATRPAAFLMSALRPWTVASLTVNGYPQESANRPAGLASQGVDCLGAQTASQRRHLDRPVAPPWRRGVHGIAEV